MKRQHLSAGLVVLTLFASTACSPDSGVERQQTGSGGSGAGASGAGASGAGSGVGGTGVGGTSAGSSGSGGVTSGAGGVAGSAGNAAGGAGGTTGGAGGAGGSPGVGCTGTELFCEDFEDDAEGVAPGAPWLAIPQHCETPDFSTEVTSEKAYTGTKSFKATNKTNYVECRSSAAFGDADEFWLRAFIWWNADVDFSGKELLAIDLHGQSGIGIDGPTVRFGSRMKEPCTASAGPQITLMAIAGGEQTGCTGTIQEPKNDWYCFEAHVTQPDGVSVKTYINGAGFQYESSGKAPTDTIDTPPDLTAVEKMKYVRIGIFSNSSATGAVYVDDLAIATTRLGCGTPVSP